MDLFLDIAPLQTNNINHSAVNNRFRYQARFASAEVLGQSLVGQRAMLLVSVGQSYHEGDKLEAAMALINRYSLSTCDIVLADTLQHYNFTMQWDRQKAFTYTRSEGDQWLQRNTRALQALQSHSKIIRWETLLSLPGYKDYQQAVRMLYESNRVYQQAIDDNVARYLQRKVGYAKQLLVQARQYCLAYLLEELPAIMPLAAQLGYDKIIYPQPITRAMAETHRHFVQPYFSNKCHWLSLRFKKKIAR